MSNPKWTEFEAFLDSLSEEDFRELQDCLQRRIEIEITSADLDGVLSDAGCGGLLSSC